MNTIALILGGVVLGFLAVAVVVCGVFCAIKIGMFFWDLMEAMFGEIL